MTPLLHLLGMAAVGGLLLLRLRTLLKERPLLEAWHRSPSLVLWVLAAYLLSAVQMGAGGAAFWLNYQTLRGGAEAFEALSPDPEGFARSLAYLCYVASAIAETLWLVLHLTLRAGRERRGTVILHHMEEKFFPSPMSRAGQIRRRLEGAEKPRRGPFIHHS